MEEEVQAITLGKAEAEVEPRQIAEGVWSIYALHKPAIGGSPLANRCLIYRVDGEAGATPWLVLVNAITPDLERDEPFAAIRKLAASLGAEVRYVFNPGPEHHLSLTPYAEAFPDAKIGIAKGRIERENPAVCALGNVMLLPPGDVCPELRARGFHVHVWDGLMEGKITNLVQARFRAKRGTAEPTLFFHEPSRTLLNGGHGWWYWGEKTFLPWPARKLFGMRQGAVVWSPYHYTVFDKDRCAASAERVLGWDFDTLLDVHVPMNDWLHEGAYAAVEPLCRPMVEGRWDALPLKHEPLEIPEAR